MAVLLGQYAEQLGRVLGAAVLLRDDDDALGLLDERPGFHGPPHAAR
jgi:hypothetical protein